MVFISYLYITLFIQLPLNQRKTNTRPIFNTILYHQKFSRNIITVSLISSCGVGLWISNSKTYIFRLNQRKQSCGFL
nr:MAG TPA: hypothetical protein [Caudoviricetes sp.]